MKWVAVTCVLACATFAWAGEDTEPSSVGEAMAAIEQDDLKTAVGTLRTLVKDEKDNPLAHHTLGVALMKQGQYDPARRSLERAHLISKQDAPPELIYNLAALEMRQRNYPRAAKIIVEFDKSRGIIIEPMLNVLGAALDSMILNTNTRNAPLYHEADVIYIQTERMFEQHRADRKMRWGANWVSAQERAGAQAARESALQNAYAAEEKSIAASREVTRAENALDAVSGNVFVKRENRPDKTREIADVRAARASYKAARANVDKAWSSIPARDWPIRFDPMMPKVENMGVDYAAVEESSEPVIRSDEPPSPAMQRYLKAAEERRQADLLIAQAKLEQASAGIDDAEEKLRTLLDTPVIRAKKLRGHGSFATQEEKDRAIAPQERLVTAQRQQIAAAVEQVEILKKQKGRYPLLMPSNKSIGSIGHLLGYRIIQVTGPESMLVTNGNDTLWIDKVSTKGYVDDQPFVIETPMEVVDTKMYQGNFGAKTVFLLRPAK